MKSTKNDDLKMNDAYNFGTSPSRTRRMISLASVPLAAFFLSTRETCGMVFLMQHEGQRQVDVELEEEGEQGEQELVLYHKSSQRLPHHLEDRQRTHGPVVPLDLQNSTTDVNIFGTTTDITSLSSFDERRTGSHEVEDQLGAIRTSEVHYAFLQKFSRRTKKMKEKTTTTSTQKMEQQHHHHQQQLMSMLQLQKKQKPAWTIIGKIVLGTVAGKVAVDTLKDIATAPTWGDTNIVKSVRSMRSAIAWLWWGNKARRLLRSRGEAFTEQKRRELLTKMQAVWSNFTDQVVTVSGGEKLQDLEAVGDATEKRENFADRMKTAVERIGEGNNSPDLNATTTVSAAPVAGVTPDLAHWSQVDQEASLKTRDMIAVMVKGESFPLVCEVMIVESDKVMLYHPQPVLDRRQKRDMCTDLQKAIPIADLHYLKLPPSFRVVQRQTSDMFIFKPFDDGPLGTNENGKIFEREQNHKDLSTLRSYTKQHGLDSVPFRCQLNLKVSETLLSMHEKLIEGLYDEQKLQLQVVEEEVQKVLHAMESENRFLNFLKSAPRAGRLRKLQVLKKKILARDIPKLMKQTRQMAKEMDPLSLLTKEDDEGPREDDSAGVVDSRSSASGRSDVEGIIASTRTRKTTSSSTNLQPAAPQPYILFPIQPNGTAFFPRMFHNAGGGSEAGAVELIIEEEEKSFIAPFAASLHSVQALAATFLRQGGLGTATGKTTELSSAGDTTTPASNVSPNPNPANGSTYFRSLDPSKPLPTLVRLADEDRDARGLVVSDQAREQKMLQLLTATAQKTFEVGISYFLGTGTGTTSPGVVPLQQQEQTTRTSDEVLSRQVQFLAEEEKWNFLQTSGYDVMSTIPGFGTDKAELRIADVLTTLPGSAEVEVDTTGAENNKKNNAPDVTEKSSTLQKTEGDETALALPTRMAAHETTPVAYLPTRRGAAVLSTTRTHDQIETDQATTLLQVHRFRQGLADGGLTLGAVVVCAVKMFFLYTILCECTNRPSFVCHDQQDKCQRTSCMPSCIVHAPSTGVLLVLASRICLANSVQGSGSMSCGFSILHDNIAWIWI
ncbi:unnamed protein product [Amoebophrya sp. A120]|nr:unnamed protein product [Amoebophrya sp. A120]|eukprot:GSA120T00004444001.1